ncbi:MAG: head GIN domain-containing protein [candidate division Zixibacteria bacterium]
MKTVLSFMLCFISLALFTSCSDDDNPANSVKITGSGNITSIERTLPDFHSVILVATGNVNIASGSQQAVSISADDNFHQYIITSVTNGILVISSSPNTTFSNNNLTVNLMMTDLENVILTGMGNIAGTNNFQVDVLDIDLIGMGNITLNADVTRLNSLLSGTGNIILSGSAVNHFYNHPGDGNLVAFNLITDTTNISLGGEGNIEIYTNDYLDGILSGSGTIYYKGQPSINLTFTGTGHLIDSN